MIVETFVSFLLTVIAALLAIPVAVFFFEIFAAIALSSRGPAINPRQSFRPRVAVLVPAHNESIGLMPTIADSLRQLRSGDRLLVVADNCADDTASIALSAGAEVIERFNLDKRGKGYALDFGLQHLALNPPEVLIVIDADCRIEDFAIERLAAACANTDRPVQALYLMVAPSSRLINHQVAEFAWRVKNWLRPLGLKALGSPCQLVGTGMAFPWKVVRTAEVASGWIVEDVKLGLDLALAGHPPLFCPEARVTSQFASSAEGARTQRHRWEQGHIETILKIIPRMLCSAVAKRNWGLLALALDLAVPPLSLLALLLVGTFILVCFGLLMSGSLVPLGVSTASLLVFFVAVLIGWLKHGRDVLPARAVPSIVPYVVGKFRLYGRIFTGRRDRQWIRTDRSNSG